MQGDCTTKIHKLGDYSRAMSILTIFSIWAYLTIANKKNNHHYALYKKNYAFGGELDSRRVLGLTPWGTLE